MACLRGSVGTTRMSASTTGQDQGAVAEGRTRDGRRDALQRYCGKGSGAVVRRA